MFLESSNAMCIHKSHICTWRICRKSSSGRCSRTCNTRCSIAPGTLCAYLANCMQVCTAVYAGSSSTDNSAAG